MSTAEKRPWLYSPLNTVPLTTSNAAELDSPEPVSYTHLDVYKRQRRGLFYMKKGRLRALRAALPARLLFDTRLRDTVALAGREKLKITEMRITSKGEIVRTDTAYPGEIVILPSDSVRLNDVLGAPTRLPRNCLLYTSSPD